MINLMINLMIRTCLFAFCIVAIAGDVAGQLTITDPAAVPSEKKSVYRTASHRSLSKLDDAMTSPRSMTQIRVRVQYLWIDAETRKAVYADLPAESIQHCSALSDDAQVDGDAEFGSTACRTQLSRPGHGTHCIVSSSQASAIVGRVKDASRSEVKRSSPITLLDGKAAEMNDLTQRPFVVSFQRDGETTVPKIQLFDEGSQLRIRAADLPADNAFGFDVEFSGASIVAIAEEIIFGIEAEPVKIQTPTHTIQTMQVSTQLSAGEVLMVDPYYSTMRNVNQQTPSPMLGRLPYVGQNFTHQENVAVQQYLIALLQPERISP